MDTGLLKLPDSVVIESLRKELSEAKIEIGKLKSYIDELEFGKRPLKKVMQSYYESHLRIYERAIQNVAYNQKAIVKRNKVYKQRYFKLLSRFTSVSYERPILLNRVDKKMLINLILAGIQYAKDNNAYDNKMKRLYRDINDQLK